MLTFQTSETRTPWHLSAGAVPCQALPRGMTLGLSLARQGLGTVHHAIPVRG